jgi:hypothetical protein
MKMDEAENTQKERQECFGIIFHFLFFEAVGLILII